MRQAAMNAPRGPTAVVNQPRPRGSQSDVHARCRFVVVFQTVSDNGKKQTWTFRCEPEMMFRSIVINTLTPHRFGVNNMQKKAKESAQTSVLFELRVTNVTGTLFRYGERVPIVGKSFELEEGQKAEFIRTATLPSGKAIHDKLVVFLKGSGS